MFDTMKTRSVFPEQVQETSNTTKSIGRLSNWMIYLILIATALPASVGREWRVPQIPNGNVFNCANCHTSIGGGGPRNSFGQAVEQRVSPGGFEAFWNAQ